MLMGGEADGDKEDDTHEQLLPPPNAVGTPVKSASPPTTGVWRSVGICLFYATCSVTLSFINKTLLSVYAFPAYLFLLCCQLVAALLCCVVLKQLSRAIGPSFDAMVGGRIPDFDLATAKKCAILSFLFVANVGSGFIGLRHIDIPLFLCLRRTCVLFTLASDYVIRGLRLPRAMVASLVLIAVGALVAGVGSYRSSGDPGDLLGMSMCMVNNVMTALYLTRTKHFSSETGIKSFGLLFYNSVLALPLTLVASMAAGELAAVREFEYWADPQFLVGLFVSSLMGVVLTFAIFLCTTVNSPLATSVTGNIKDIVSTGASFVIFNDAVPGATVVGGLAISFCGAWSYSAMKLRKLLRGDGAETLAKPVVNPRSEKDGT